MSETSNRFSDLTCTGCQFFEPDMCYCIYHMTDLDTTRVQEGCDYWQPVEEPDQ